MIHKIIPSVDYILDTPLNEPTNQNSMQASKVVVPTNKKNLLYILGD